MALMNRTSIAIFKARDIAGDASPLRLIASILVAFHKLVSSSNEDLFDRSEIIPNKMKNLTIFKPNDETT